MAKKRKILKTRPGRRVKKAVKSRRKALPGKAKSKSRTTSHGAAFSVSKAKRKKKGKSDAKSQSKKKLAKNPKRAKSPKRPKRDALGRFKSTRKANPRRARAGHGSRATRVNPRRRRATPVAFDSHDEVKFITSQNLGGEFEMHKRTLSFKNSPPRVEKLPYKPQIKKAAEKFFDERGPGKFLYKTKITLQDEDGELFDRWFTPHARQTFDSKEEFTDTLDDLTLTIQELSRGYVQAGFENYRLEEIEMEAIDASQFNAPLKAGKK